MDFREYSRQVEGYRDEMFRLAREDVSLIKEIIADKGNITEEMLYDGEGPDDRDWIWLDYKWDELYGDLRLVEISKEGDGIRVKSRDDRMDEYGYNGPQRPAAIRYHRNRQSVVHNL